MKATLYGIWLGFGAWCLYENIAATIVLAQMAAVKAGGAAVVIVTGIWGAVNLVAIIYFVKWIYNQAQRREDSSYHLTGENGNE